MDRFDEMVRDLPPGELDVLIERAKRINRLKRFGAPAVAILTGGAVAAALFGQGKTLEYAAIIGGIAGVAALVLAGLMLRRADNAFERDLDAALARARVKAGHS